MNLDLSDVRTEIRHAVAKATCFLVGHKSLVPMHHLPELRPIDGLPVEANEMIAPGEERVCPRCYWSPDDDAG